MDARKIWINVFKSSGVTFGIVVSILTLTVGLMASFWNESIKSSWLSFTINPSHIDVKATVFWITVVIWFVFFSVRQKSDSESLSVLQANARLTSETVLALPPKSFFDYYSKHVCSLRVYPFSTGDREIDKSEQCIRNLLRVVTNLAKAYDARPTARYAANIMIYVPKAKSEMYQHSKKFDDFDIEYDVRRFLSGDFSMSKIQGLLYAPKVLSVAGDLGEPDPDIEENFVFPILSEAKTHDGAWRVLPGAPVSFLKWNQFMAAPARQVLHELGEAGNPVNFETKIAERGSLELRHAAHGLDNLQNIDRFIDKRESLLTFDIDGERFQFGEHSAKKIKEYYAKSHVKSFLSMPLVLGDGSFLAFGILNIHCDSPTFLGAPTDDVFRRRPAFSSMISSIVFDISESVTEWQGLA